jgi:hypothetical protein
MNTQLDRSPGKSLSITLKRHPRQRLSNGFTRNRILHSDGEGAVSQIALEESLVVDSRACMRPAQLVEQKLGSLLKNVLLPVSHVRLTGVCPGRSHC